MTDHRREDQKVTPEAPRRRSTETPQRPGAERNASAGDVLEDRLRAAYRRKAMFHLGRGLGWLVICLVALVLVDLALDASVELHGFFRFVLLIGNVAALAYVVVRLVLPHLRRFDAVRTALQVEKARPGINSLLVSAVQFRRGAMAPAHSEDLVELVEAQAAAEVERVEPSAIADFRRIRPVLIGGAVAILALIALVAVWPAHMAVLAQRLVNPFSVAQYPTDTEIYATTGDVLVRQNTSLVLEARARASERAQAAPAGNEPAQREDKIVPEEALLWVNMGNGWESISIEREEDDRYSYVFPQVYRELDYYFEIGDARSLRYEVNVVEPPRVQEARVQFEYPDYVSVDLPDEVLTLNVKVPEATTVNWELTVDRNVQNPVLNIEGRDPLQPIDVAREDDDDDSPVTFKFRAPARASASYALEFDWTLKDREFHERGPRHFLRVIPDNAPSVALTYPARDLKATLDKDMVLEYRASDDYGLDEAWLIYGLNEQQEQRVSLGKIQNGQTVQREVQWDLMEQLPDLQEGDIVTFSVEVSDGRPDDEASRGRSRSRRVQFVSQADYLNYLMAQQRKFLGRIRPLYRHEMEASERIRELVTESEEDGEPADGTREEGRQ